MLSIGKLGQGQADYYLQSVAKGIEDYYAGEGEAPGEWMGTAADELDVFGQVEVELLHRALSGKHPGTGAQLARPARGAIRVTGFDLTFSAPKSVSLLFGLGDDRVAEQVREAHGAAVRAALGYMERHAAVGRRGRGGTESVQGNGFLGAAFRHRSSRAGDPQLHTHVLVANMTRGPDRRWTALDARRLYAHAKTGGYLYQAHLRAQLTERLGVEWTPVRRGVADVSGIPANAIRAFSRRAAEIRQRLADRGESSARAAQVATLDTRQAKDYGVSAATLRERWAARAAELGLDPNVVGASLNRPRPVPLSRQDLIAVHDVIGSAQGLTQHRSTFVRRDVVQAWCEQLRAGATVEEVETLADEFLGSDRAVPLLGEATSARPTEAIRRNDGRIVAGPAEERPHSTPELLALERQVIAGVLKRRAEGTGTVDPALVEDAIRRRPTLSEEQADMIRELTTDGAGVDVVVGKAGTGKTFALDAAREAWQRGEYRVVGAALARRAARELQDGSGIESTSVAALLEDLRAYGLPADGRTVIVIDEAGMVGTRHLAELLDHASRAWAKVVLVGDDRQLPEIEAGGAFRGLLTRITPIELAHNRRQEQLWERDALELLRAGRTDDALARYQRHGRVILADTAEGAYLQLVDDWWQAARAGEQAVMVAARRDDVGHLNALARARMSADGRLGAEHLKIHGRAFAVGDEVIALQNARRLDVLNGTRGAVIEIDLAGCQLTMQTIDGRSVTLPRAYLESRTARGGATLDHGYALTGHKAQGMTTGRAFVLGTEDLYREWGYVALSRGRAENRLYVVAPEPPDRDEIAPPEPGRDPLDAITDALRRSRMQEMAVDVSARAEIARLPTPQLSELRAGLVGETPDSRRVMRQRRRLDAIVTEREQAESLIASPAGAAPAVVMHARDRLAELAEIEHSLRDQLEEMAGPRASADAARVSAIDRELTHRRNAVARAALVQPASYLVDLLGHEPDRPSERQAWRRAVRLIEAYRFDHDIRDAGSALGPKPQDAAQAVRWQACQHQVAARLQERGRSADPALTRDLADR